MENTIPGGIDSLVIQQRISKGVNQVLRAGCNRDRSRTDSRTVRDPTNNYKRMIWR